MNASVNPSLLEQYIHNFFGYGNLEGKYWFIGMEEGGGNSAAEIQSRISGWEKAGNTTLLDIYKFHKRIRHYDGNTVSKWFNGKRSKYQPTWGGLIKTLLSAQHGELPSLEAVKRFQSREWGRHDSNNALLEVFPLPSPDSGQFLYADWNLETLPYLSSRAAYKQAVKTTRINKLKTLMKQYRPEVVHFYSSNPEYLEYWSAISGIDFNRVNNQVISQTSNKQLVAKIAKLEHTVFVVTHHPAYSGVSDKYHEGVGKLLRQ